MNQGPISCRNCKHRQYSRYPGRGWGLRGQNRAGFTVLELLVTFGIITTLVSLILPAVNSAREAARQLQCKNQLKQLGLALHSYHDSYRCLPAGWQWEQTNHSAYGWAVPLLPYLEQRAIYEQVDRNQVLSHVSNTAARETVIVNFLCPSDIVDPTFMLYQEHALSVSQTPIIKLPTASYVGVFGTLEADDSIPAPPGDGTFLESIPVSFRQLQRGLTQTIIVGERTMSMVPSTWLGVDSLGEDAACRLVGSALTKPNCKVCDECEFSSRHPGGVNFLWADGHVSLLSDSLDTNTYQQLSRRMAQ